MANLNAIGRLQVLLRMLHPQVIDDATTLANAKLDGPTSLKYALPFYTVYNGPQLYEEDGVTPRDPTNAELAAFVLSIYRRRTREIRQEYLAIPVGIAAKEAEQATIQADFTTDLGSD